MSGVMYCPIFEVIDMAAPKKPGQNTRNQGGFYQQVGPRGGKRGLTIIGTKTYAKAQSSSSGPRSGRIPPRATGSASKNA